MTAEEQVKSIIKNKIKEKYDLELGDFELSVPPKDEMGDYAFGAFNVSKLLKKNPMETAGEIKSVFEEISEFTKIDVAGPYLNIFISKDIMSVYFAEIYANKEHFGETGIGKNKTIVVDYIGSNIGKPLHIGHMCSPNLGQVMISVYKKLGYSVIGDNHLGDWGIIFGKLIFAYKYYGEQKEKLETEAIDYLLKLYVDITREAEKNEELDSKFRETFKKLSSGDEEYINLWRDFTDYSNKDLVKQLKRLGVKPDFNIGESFYEGLNLPKLENIPDLKYNMSDIVSELVNKKIATPNEDGSVGIIFPENTKIPSCMLQKRDGTKGYFAADLAAIKYRKENWNPYKIVYFIANEQKLHLTQVFEVAQMAGWLGNGDDETKLFHAMNGFISLKEGRMSTRKGRIIKLNDLLNEAVSRAKNIILEKRQDFSETELETLANIIGIGAIKYGYLSKNRTTDVVFDWDEFMTFEGNSGPYIQYAYVRARNILSKSEIDFSLKTSYNFELQEETSLLKTIFSYNSILEETVKGNFPHILAGYAYDLTKKFNSFYNNVTVLNEENTETKIARLQLTEMFSIVLKDVFGLLAIEMPEKM